jgi:hypothetical protein
MNVTSVGMIEPPAGYKYIGESVVSNADHVVNQSILTHLQQEPVIADYPGWNFYAHVWYEAGFFRCMVFQYHAHIDTLQSESFDDLKEKVCSRFGSG